MPSVFSVQQAFQRFAAGAPVTQFYFVDHYIGAFGVFAQHVGQYLRNAFNKLLFLLLGDTVFSDFVFTYGMVVLLPVALFIKI